MATILYKDGRKEFLTDDEFKVGARDGFFGTPRRWRSRSYVAGYAEGFFARKGNEKGIDGTILQARTMANIGKAILAKTKSTKRSRKTQSTSSSFKMSYERTDKIIALLKECEQEAQQYAFKEEKTQVVSVFDYLIDEMLLLRDDQRGRSTGKGYTKPEYGGTALVKKYPYKSPPEKMSKEAVDTLKAAIKGGKNSMVVGKHPSRLPVAKDAK